MTTRPYRLTARFAATVTECGRFGDGRGSGGLSLLVKRTAGGDLAKSWSQRIVIDGRPRNIGLGSFPHVSLAQAREVCQENRAKRRRGELVLTDRRAVPTFTEAAETVIALHSSGWRDGGKCRKQWEQTLRDYAFPTLGGLRVDRITTAHVMGLLLPIWNGKRVTAQRVRARVSTVCQWAVAKGYRSDDPAGSALAAALPKNGVERTHQRALPNSEVAAALAKVRDSGTAPAFALALEFQVLTAARPGEVRGAQWEEIDMERALWTVPPERMKGGREHRVPLSPAAVRVLREAAELGDGSGLVFPSPRCNGRMIGEASLAALLRDLGIGCVPHGFRSSFRVWAAECSDVSREVAEAALAHIVRNPVERAYRRTDLLDKRVALMANWADYLGA